MTYRPEWMLPTATMAINAGSALTYLVRGDFRMFVYWCAAVTLTACVTFR